MTLSTGDEPGTEAVVLTGPDDRVQHWNAAATALYGYTAEEAAGRVVIDLVVPESERAAAAAHRALIRAGEGYSGAWRVRHKSGREFTVHASTTPVTAPDGRLLGSVDVSYDVTTRAAAAPRHRTVTADHGLRELLRLHHSGASPATIAAALNGEGYRTPRGLRWHRVTVARAVSDVVFPDLRPPAP